MRRPGQVEQRGTPFRGPFERAARQWHRLAAREETGAERSARRGLDSRVPVTVQVGTPAAVQYVEHGGILHYVLRRMLTEV